jgi:hypothetical protein
MMTSALREVLMSDSPKKNLDTSLEGIDADRRQFLRKIVLTSAFTAPIVASFAVDGMLVSSALAAACPPNQTCTS